MNNIREISGLLVHSVANIMPMMSVAELDALALDIQEHGLREPIWLFVKDGIEYIIDGRNRALACQKINIIPEYRYYEGDESSLLNFVISLNISRRHLSPGQKACLAVEILPMIEEQTKKNLSEKMKTIRAGGIVEKGKRSNEIAGEIFGVGVTNIKSAKKLLNENKDLFQKVMSGELSLNKAIVQIKEVGSNSSQLAPVNDINSEHNADVLTSELSQDGSNSSQLAPVNDINSEHNADVLTSELSQDGSNSSQLEMTKAELRKVSEYIKEMGVTEKIAIAYVVKKRKPKAVAKPKTSFSNRIEFKVDESEKELLMQQAKAMNMSLSEYIRSLIKKG